MIFNFYKKEDDISIRNHCSRNVNWHVFLKRQKPTSPKSWLKGIGLIILSIIIVNGFYHIDEILNGAKKEQEDIQNRQNPK
ncbi:hypothetical protein [Staphylococcus equorum]|uniref:hypothetical protein n=1 Tax=Staphylococcus equorum TaxID=246432 RepID=UPI0021BE3869|nr:hypothetical protein [Staphylococcus equorum]